VSGGAGAPGPAVVDVAAGDEATATDAVARWMLDHVGDLAAPLRFVRVAGGHSCLTFVVTDAHGRRVVLRRPPLGHVLASAHDVLREHRIMDALRGTGVPVPRMLAACDDRAVNEAPFYVMNHVDGPVLHDADTVRRVFHDVAARRRASESMVDAMVALHGVDVDAVGLGDLARRGGYVDRQLKRWRGQWEASKTRELPAMERLYEWLVAHRPARQRHPRARRLGARRARLGAVHARRSPRRPVVPAARLGRARRAGDVVDRGGHPGRRLPDP
jgi:aminoglycoside phosphotransferase (APT) family kinase protein